MKILKSSISVILLLFITSCNRDYKCYLASDKCTIINIM